MVTRNDFPIAIQKNKPIAIRPTTIPFILNIITFFLMLYLNYKKVLLGNQLNCIMI